MPNLDCAPEPPATTEPRRRARKRIFALLLTAIVLSVAVWLYYFQPYRVRSAGGIYFFQKLVLPVPRFAQGDPRWGSDLLGPTENTMGAEGCAVSSAAMVLSFYGVNVDPGRLNDYLGENGGYTPQGWVYWEKAAAFPPTRARHVYEDLPSYYLLDANLWRGNPMIVRVRLASGTSHFVVVVGKEGFHYLIQDPARAGEKGPYRLSSLVSQIDALRFFQRLP